jgi:hypothetical protein
LRSTRRCTRPRALAASPVGRSAAWCSSRRAFCLTWLPRGWLPVYALVHLEKRPENLPRAVQLLHSVLKFGGERQQTWVLLQVQVVRVQEPENEVVEALPAPRQAPRGALKTSTPRQLEDELARAAQRRGVSRRLFQQSLPFVRLERTVQQELQLLCSLLELRWRSWRWNVLLPRRW